MRQCTRTQVSTAHRASAASGIRIDGQAGEITPFLCCSIVSSSRKSVEDGREVEINEAKWKSAPFLASFDDQTV